MEQLHDKNTAKSIAANPNDFNPVTRILFTTRPKTPNISAQTAYCVGNDHYPIQKAVDALENCLSLNILK